MQSLSVFCAKFHNILCKKIAAVTNGPIIAFSINLYAHEMFASREFRTNFVGSRQKAFGDPLARLLTLKMLALRWCFHIGLHWMAEK